MDGNDDQNYWLNNLYTTILNQPIKVFKNVQMTWLNLWDQVYFTVYLGCQALNFGKNVI